MIYEQINIEVDYKKAGIDYEGLCPTLTSYSPVTSEEIHNKPYPAVLVLPGGGYDYCSDREAEPVALKFLGMGIAAFVLRYSCVKKKYPTALLEALTALKYIRENAERFYIDPDKISVMGFSAGAHLAGCVSNFYHDKEILSYLGASEEEVKPDKSVLCYPVLTSGEYTHEGSILNLLADGGDDKLRAKLSLENQVSGKTPETFLWHTADDNCVPIENTLLYMSALSKNKIPFEAHIYEWGGHGLSLCDETTMYDSYQLLPVNANWVTACADFMKRY
ncbi:MAG: alpha/beta hydrolase [Ruminococcus sp.]|nr:alpha/beta hydrolase [Ruminococcus sp.]